MIFFSLLSILCELLSLAIFLRVVISWVAAGQTNSLTNFLYKVTEPILSPLRRAIPRFGTLDFSPLVAIILLQIIAWLLP
ncbi:MAG: YggT family protein [Dehalococcoidales bacterium]|nr:YggT family protein [Dehalococcoidales bacterium]